MKKITLKGIAGMVVAFMFTACTTEGTLKDIQEEEVTPFSYSTADWMREMQLQHPEQEIRLLDICFPRSHDAGMYVVQHCTVGGNACNVQTQDKDMKTQLMDGIRAFDIRPLYKNNFFFTRHSLGCDGLGCWGARVDQMMRELREFLDQHSELVIIEFGQWCYTSGTDPLFQQMIEETLGDRVYKETEENPLPFIQRPLREIIPTDVGTGKAILLYDGVANSPENRAEGIFHSNYIPRDGKWSNAQAFATMQADQFAEYASFPHDGSELFEFSWTLTQDEAQALSCILPTNQVSIQSLAVQANNGLASSMDELIAAQAIRKGTIPNIISIDFCAPFVTLECIDITLINLD